MMLVLLFSSASIVGGVQSFRFRSVGLGALRLRFGIQGSVSGKSFPEV